MQTDSLPAKPLVVNVALCFGAILKYGFWKNEGKIFFPPRKRFSANGDSVFIIFFFGNFAKFESLKRNKEGKSKNEMKLTLIGYLM